MSDKANAYNEQQISKGNLQAEHVTELVEHWQASHDLEIDGKAGPVTISTIDAKIAPAQVTPSPDVLKPWDGPETTQPKNRRGTYEMFGSPGNAGHPDKKWERANIIECHPRLGNQLPGVPGNRWIKVHKRVEPYLREALRRVQLVAPEYQIERIAAFNFRHMRHDPSKPLSMHSWGIAVDIDPHKNFSRHFKRGEGPKGWSPEYMKIWPNGLPKVVVQAFQSCGWVFGSDWDEDGELTDHTFYDPMHFEWVARDGNSMEV